MIARAAVGLKHTGKEAGECCGPLNLVLHPLGLACHDLPCGPLAELWAGLNLQPSQLPWGYSWAAVQHLNVPGQPH